MSVERAAAWVEQQLWHDMRSNHLRKQFNRFVWSFLAALYASLAASHFHVTWSTLLALVPPALWVGAEEAWPSLPWSKVHEYLHAVKQPPILPPEPSPPAVPPAGPAGGGAPPPQGGPDPITPDSKEVV